jgi:hypothetical protein
MGSTRVRSITFEDEQEKHIDARAIIVLDVFKVCLSISTKPKLYIGEWKGSDKLWLMVFRVMLVLHAGTHEPPEAAFEVPVTIGYWASKKFEGNVLYPYQMEWNFNSLYNLTGLMAARRDRGERLWVGDMNPRARMVLVQRNVLMAGVFIGILLALLVRAAHVLVVRV